jgi:hypothetical protein
MASETLVVASDINGYRDASNGHATLFTPGDSFSLERAIENALHTANDERRAAASAYAEKWSMNNLVDAYEERYEQAQLIFRATQ